MLTSDLVQVRFYRGEVRPRYVKAEDPENLALAEQLIDTFEAHVGQPRHALDRELREILGSGTEFLLHRALAKLLSDRCTFAAEAPVEPEILRRAAFAAAAAAYRTSPEEGRPLHFAAGDRAAVIEQVAGEFELEPATLERSLYADLKDEQILQAWDRCTPQWLLERYNVALAQGVLLRAADLEIRIRGRNIQEHRALFRKIKFFQLLHRVEKDADGGYRIRLDGPLSLFKSSARYGVRMASFLPTLLHLDDWTLEAALLWGKRRRECSFRLSPEVGLRPYTTRLSGQWQPEELTWLPEQFAKLDTQWRLSTDAELVELAGQGVLVPDYVFHHPPSGTRVFMEVFGFWRRGAVVSRLELLRRHGPENMILALSKQLAAGQEGLDEIPGEVYVFRTAPVARKVLAVLERIRLAER
ncbi:MAG: DUF790 family protein [bacterium]|nr:DUF790 family protein [bacterium]